MYQYTKNEVQTLPLVFYHFGPPPPPPPPIPIKPTRSNLAVYLRVGLFVLWQVCSMLFTDIFPQIKIEYFPLSPQNHKVRIPYTCIRPVEINSTGNTAFTCTPYSTLTFTPYSTLTFLCTVPSCLSLILSH